jgi:hypothetical protein
LNESSQDVTKIFRLSPHYPGARKKFRPLRHLEIALVLVRLDQIASGITRDGKRFVVRADEKADLRFLELEAAIRVSRQIGLTSVRDFLQTERR